MGAGWEVSRGALRLDIMEDLRVSLGCRAVIGVSCIHTDKGAWLSTFPLNRYLMLAVVFGESNDDLHVDPTATGAVAFLFIGIAYAASIVIAFFKRSSKAFILRSILMSAAPSPYRNRHH